MKMKTAALLVAGMVLTMIVLHDRRLVRGEILALYDLSFYRHSTTTPVSPVEARLVAHAGGAVQGQAYTNAREALDQHYAEGYRVFELDFDWTADGQLVLSHDWKTTSSQFNMSPHVFQYQEFVDRKRRDGLHQLTFEDLRAWLRKHPDALVVTDTKGSNKRLLDYLRVRGRDILSQLIIQIYRLPELQEARQLNPRAVWLTVYRSSYPAWALARITGIDAFVIPVGSYAQYNNPQLLARTHFYIHSIPAESVDETAKRFPGVYGYYVD